MTLCLLQYTVIEVDKMTDNKSRLSLRTKSGADEKTGLHQSISAAIIYLSLPNLKEETFIYDFIHLIIFQ